MSVRADGRARVDLERLGHAIDRISETWDEQARRARHRSARARSRASGSSTSWHGSTTAEYRARTRPADAVADFRQVAATGRVVGTRSPPRSGGRSTRWATTGASACTSVDRAPTLAELVPILGQLGLQAVEEHPVTFDVGGESGVALRDRRARRPRRDRRTAADRSCSARSSVSCSARSSRDELNRLILGGRPRDPPGRGAAALPPVPAPGRVPVQCAVHRADAGAAVGDRPLARRIVRRPFRPGAAAPTPSLDRPPPTDRRSLLVHVSTRCRHSTRTGSAGPSSR